MNISIYNRSNSLIYSGNCDIRLKYRVMGEETATVTVVSEGALTFGYGDYVDMNGARFYLHTSPKKTDSGTHIVYTLTLESAKYELIGSQFQSFGRAKYDITTDLEGWVKLIVDNANRIGSGWSYVINEPVAGFKTLVVDGDNCLGALNRVYADFGKEFKVVGKQIVVGRVGADLGNVLKVGRYEGLYNVSEEQSGTASPITRLYVYGSDKNLPTNYNNADGSTPTDRLTVKAVNGGKAYIEDAAKIALYGLIEGSYTNEDIYPHRTGTISSVDAANIQNFIDSSMDFDVNAQLLPGVAAKVTFVSGDLSGYTFDVISYNATAKQVRIAVGNDGSGKELPNATFKPKVGDKYVFTDIAMPQSYITAGETDLLADGQAEYAKVSGWQSEFKITALDPIYQQDLNFYPYAGDRIGVNSGGVIKQVRIVEYGVNLTSGVPIYDGLQLADKVEPSLAQQEVNSQQSTATDIYVANKNATTAQTTATSAATSATAASAAATAATEAATNAQDAADNANDSIADIASDDKITAGEKQSLKREWDVIVSEKDKNVQQADTFGVSRTAYVTAYSDLLTFLGTNLNDLTTTWNLGNGGGVTLRSKFKGYYDARTDLLNAISLKAKQAADAAQNAANAVQQGALMKSSATQQVVNSPVQFVGQVQINGDIIQNGAAYETHAQHVFSSNDFLTLRDGAVANLAASSYTGFQSKRVFGDGTDGYLVFGADGMARVGKQASLQMLATREDAPLDGGVAVWSAANKRFNGVAASTLSVGDSAKLGGRAAADYWHKDNLNRGDTDFTARKGIFKSTVNINDRVFVGDYDEGVRVKGAANEWCGIFLGTDGTDTGNTSWQWNLMKTASDTFVIGRGNSDTRFIELTNTGICKFSNSVQSNTYTGAGFTATGWGITTDGDANFRNHTVRGKLTTYEFVQNKISIANGNMIVSDNAKVSSIWFWTGSGTTGTGQNVRYIFDEPHPFKVGDVIKCQSKGKVYTVIVGWINTEGTVFDAYGAYNDTGVSSSAAGDLLVRWNSTDATRKGLLYLCSSDAGSPNYQVLYDGAVKAQFGNLEGRAWLGSALPANTWGLWAENAYLSGAVNASSGYIGQMIITNGELQSPRSGNRYHYIDVNSIGTYDITVGYINKIHRDGSGLLASGNIAWDATGNVTFADSVKMQWTSYDYANGECLNPDVYFSNTSGTNGIGVYNNFGNGNVGVNNVAKSADCPSPSGRMLRVTFNGAASPGYGGFTFWTSSYASGKFITRFIAKIPVGCTINWASNGIGDGNNARWLTPRSGTGKFEEYRFLTECGASGSFSSTNYFYLDGNMAYPFTLDIACAAVYDITKPNKQLTRIDANGIYTGTVIAENIIGNTISGKSIIGLDSVGKKAIMLDGTSGTLSTYSNDGTTLASRLSRGELSFNNAAALTSLQLSNSDIKLDSLLHANDIAIDNFGRLSLNTVGVSNSFYVDSTKIGRYNAVFSVSISVSVEFVDRYGMASYSVSANMAITLEKQVNGGWEAVDTVGSYTSSDSGKGSEATCRFNANIKILANIYTAGTYRLSYKLTSNADGYDDGERMDMTSLTGVVYHDNNTILTLIQNGNFIGTNGFSAYNSGANKYVSVDINDSVVLRVRGNTDVSGVLLAGKINPDGYFESNKMWGAKYIAGSVSSSKQNNGVFRITHNLGHTKYVCTANATVLYNGNAACSCTIIDEQATYCDVQVKYNTTWVDTVGVNFAIIGYNY
jgi:hypothetical protein